ncbi:sulfotransferase domain-containing protein [Hanstruepera flava]|uniref:sulfotransferase domain-containing protein n=1 Tax=Hanstruepera flava TaxID=2930218 RepID=UPI0020286E6B|nr:sulfotransferase domain-containing protein [Hanstruepera flava]
MSIFKKKTNNHFIIAAPRSGTTWMSKMLNAHEDVFCVERRLFGDYADFVLDEGQEIPRLRITLDKYINSMLLHHGYPRKQKESMLRSVIAGVLNTEREFSRKKVVVDKVTPYIHTADKVLSQIDTFFPKAKILFLVRDGRDVLTSGVFHWFNKQPIGSALSTFEQERRTMYLHNERKKGTRFFQDKEIEQWATEWMQPLQTIQEAKKNHEVKVVHYEDVLKDTNSVLRECLTFLGAKTNESMIKTCLEVGDFKRMSQGRERGDAQANAHVRKGVSGDWKNYFTYADGKLFHEIAGSSLVAFGYEENDSWVEGLR